MSDVDDSLPFELTIPGEAVAIPDDRAAFEILELLQLILHAFSEATAAVLLFEQQPFGRPVRVDIEEQRAAYDLALKAVAGTAYDPSRVRDHAKRQLMKNNYSKGVPPRGIRGCVPSLHAKAFVYATDELGRLISKLELLPDAPTAVSGIRDRFYLHFDSIQAIRDSCHHMEDRGRGVNKQQQPIQFQPVANELFDAPRGVLALGCLNGNRFGTTSADGRYCEVEVSLESVAILRGFVEDVLRSFPWEGEPENFPS